MFSNYTATTTPLRKAKEILTLLDDVQTHYTLSRLYNDTSVQWNKAEIDSRLIEPNNFFIALQGEVSNGGLYVNEAIARGARTILIEKPFEQFIDTSVAVSLLVIVVENTLDTMCALASRIRTGNKDTCTIIGITGSAGKTSTKAILYHLLRDYQGAVCSEGNLNTVQGVSLCMINLDWNAKKFGVFECGISQRGEMSRLVSLLSPDYALVTNVGHAHIGGYSTIDELRREKLSIASTMTSQGILWIPDDDVTLMSIAHAMNLECKIALHGEKELKNCISVENTQLEGSVIHCKDEKFHVPLLGKVNAKNTIVALQIAEYFGMPRSQSTKSVRSLSPAIGRYQVLSHNPMVIDDSYNANPEAVKTMLSWFSELSYVPKIAVIAGMKELGEESALYHNDMVHHSSTLALDLVILFGEEFADVVLPNEHTYVLSNTTDIKKIIDAHITENACIIFKGSRFYQLEKTAHALSNKDFG